LRPPNAFKNSFSIKNRNQQPKPTKQKKAALAEVKDATLRHCLQFGVGLHHAGLADGDRALCERLFVAQKIQVRDSRGGKGGRAAEGG
jgi:replicative superfamily II helicase